MLTVSENRMSETPASTWLTVSDAAAALGVSERAVQKRCVAGKMKARRVTTPQGARWEIAADDPALSPEPTNRTPEPANRTSEPNERTDEPAPEPESELNQAPEPANQTNARTEPTNQTNQRPNRTDEPDFMAHLLEENKFLRGVVEAQNRDAAELRAALRSALAAMPKGLPAGEPSAANVEPMQVLADTVSSREDAHQQPEKAATTVVSSGTTSGPEMESASASTWTSRTFRSWLLKVLRG